MTPREELEARLTALLLGELPEEEATVLRQALAQDAELARLHARLQRTIGLVQETVAAPATEPTAHADAPKLASERREKLLATFKTPRPTKSPRTGGIQWSKVNWREFAALAAMVMALLAVGATLLKDSLPQPRLGLDFSFASSKSSSDSAKAFPETINLPGGGRAAIQTKGYQQKALKLVGGYGRDAEWATITSDPGPPAVIVSPQLVDSPPPTSPVYLPAAPPARLPLSVSGAVSRESLDAVDAYVENARKEREKGGIAVDVQRSQSDFFQAETAPDRANVAGRDGRSGGMGGGGVDGPQFVTPINGPASDKRDDKRLPTSGTVAGTMSSFDSRASGLGAKDISGPVSLGIKVSTVSQPEARTKEVETAWAPKALGDAVSKPVALDDNVQVKVEDQAVVAGTNMAAVSAFDFAEKNIAPAQQTWAAMVPQDGKAFFNSNPEQNSQTAFGANVNQGRGRAANESGIKANQPAPVSGLAQPEVFSQTAVGYVNGDESKPKGLAAKPDADNDLAFRVNQRPKDSLTDGIKDQATESTKLRGMNRGAEYAGVGLATGGRRTISDAEKQVSEFKRESVRALGDKPQPTPRFAEDTTLHKNRVEIALPKGERGDSIEKLQIATGLVAAKELSESDPMSAVPARQNLARTQQGSDELRRKLDSIRLPELHADGLPLAQVLETLNREAKKADPQNKGINIILNTAEDPVAPPPAAIYAATGLPVNAAATAVDDINATTIKINTPRHNLTLGEALDAISKSAERPIKVSLESYGVVVSLDKKHADDAQKAGSLALREADLSQVLDAYQKVTGRTVLKPNSLPPSKITIKSAIPLDRPDLTQALDSILSVNGIAMVPQGDKFVKAVPEGTARNTGKKFDDLPWELLPQSGKVVTHLVQLSNAAPQEVASMLQQFAKLPGNNILTVSNSDVLVLRDYEENVHRMEEMVRKLELNAPVPQGEVETARNAFSTFSLNVSDVSFKLAAASLEKGQMPDPATVRSEEFINAFDYRDPEPKGSAPIAFAWERARYPFAHDRDLLRFSVKTAASGRQPGRPLNLVLLLDNSGSMERVDRVRIIQECLRVLAGQLQTQDVVSVVAFARTPRLWVDGLPGNQAGELPQRVGGLAPQGGTNLEDAMNLAYQTALRHYLANGVNRVVLLTDGAANLGDVQPESLKQKVESHRKQGIALDCFGIGWEGFNDELLETLSRNGDGRYGFVNSPEAATSEFAGQLAGALKVAASDVKVQVEFNPRRAIAYRQIGYAKHQLKKEQFRDNTVDAAEIGAAEAGNALYVVQVNPAGEGPIGVVRVRFKVPGTSDYREHEWPVPYDGAARPLEQSSATMRLAASASAFSEWLVSSPYAGEVTPDQLLGYLNGVPETSPADPRPKKLEWMIRQAKSVAGK